MPSSRNKNHDAFPSLVRQYGEWPDFNSDPTEQVDPSEATQAAIQRRIETVREYKEATAYKPEPEAWTPPQVPSEISVE